MRNVHYSLRWASALLLIGLLAACFARLQDNGNTDRQGELQVLSPLPKEVVAPAPPTTDTLALTSTVYPPPLPTPIPASGEEKEGPTPTVTPTPAKVVNLAEGVPLTETMRYEVRHADGSYEKWLVPTTLLPGDETYPQVRNKILNLGPQDAIVDASVLLAPSRMSPGSSLDLSPLTPGPLTSTVIITGTGH